MTNSTEPPLPPFPTLAKHLELTREVGKIRLKIDGITFPWHFATEPTVTIDHGIHFLNLSIPASSVAIDLPPAPTRLVNERHDVGAAAVAKGMAKDASLWARQDERYREEYGVDVGPHSTGLPRGPVPTVGGDDDQAGDGIVESDGAVAFRCGAACSVAMANTGALACDVTDKACPSGETLGR